MQPILQVEGLTKNFTPPCSFSEILRLNFKPYNPVTALKDISFSLEKGKILGILGPNGAGKTTLLKVIATLILPDQGRVSVNGAASEENIKSSVGLLLDEERSFYWRLTGRQNLEFFCALYGLSRKSAESRINELLDLFEVDYAQKRFGAYSTGMKRHFALMRALLHNPCLLLLDEPTKSLDYSSGLRLVNFIKENLIKKEGKTIIFTTHHMEEALELCDLFMILHSGSMRAFGSYEQLRRQIKNPAASLADIFVRLTSSDENV